MWNIQLDISPGPCLSCLSNIFDSTSDLYIPIYFYFISLSLLINTFFFFFFLVGGGGDGGGGGDVVWVGSPPTTRI
jgi:hypothetical protein